MAAYDLAPPPARGATSRRLSDLFRTAFSALMTWNDTRLSRAALKKLTERQLLDLGLTRGDIDSLSTRR